METVSRNSKETNIVVILNLYGKGDSKINTTIPFLDHVLEAFSKHGLIDLEVKAKGDTHIDQHHLLEDIGLVLGQAIKKSIGDKKGIARAGFFGFPMDDSLGLVAIDLSGRPFLVYKAPFKRQFVGDLDTDCLREFFSGLSMGLQANISVYVPYGINDHHKVESLFKALGRALKMSVELKEELRGEVLSTKELLDDNVNNS